MDFLDVDGKDEEEIVFDVFDLNSLQRTLFREMEDKRMTVKDLASKADRNRSTVQRALQDMLEKDIIMREGKTDKTVYYVYTTLPMGDVKDATREALDSWHQEVEKRLS